ncbi:MAG: hypothetical protein PF694_13395 [Bacteroidetes bacterium]|jgi:hypothetical protein|nr:hypothetical protein [Bacteroidota bacterium]
MTISSLTYEAYLLDLAEGNLADEEAMLLEKFIREHPELGDWEELTEDLPLLQASEQKFEPKVLLKAIADESENQPILNKEHFDWHAISFLENELNHSNKKKFRAFLAANPVLQIDFALLQKTMLTADERICFENKNELKVSASIKPVLSWQYFSAIAASLLLMLSISWWFVNDNTTTPVYTEPLIAMKSRPANNIFTANSVEINAVAGKADNTEPNKLIPQHYQRSNTVAMMPSLAMTKAETISWTPLAGLFYADENRTLYYFYDESAVFAKINDNSSSESKSLAGLIIANAAGKIKQVFTGKDIAEPQAETQLASTKSSKINSIIKLAETGIKTYNMLTDNEVALEKTLNNNGELHSVRFKSESISFSKQLEKPKQP